MPDLICSWQLPLIMLCFKRVVENAGDLHGKIE